MTSEDKDDAFARWQNITIMQLGYVVNLLLGMTLAALGFGASLLLKELVFCWWKGCVFTSMIFLFASLVCGILCVINRLRDFRLTKDIARKKAKEESADLDQMRKRADMLGKRTWHLFWFQIGAFSLGVFLMFLGAMSGFAVNNF